jgi:hypothetical protein
VQRDEFGAAQCAGEPEQQQRAVAASGVGVRDPLEHLLEVLELEGVLAPDRLIARRRTSSSPGYIQAGQGAKHLARVL